MTQEYFAPLDDIAFGVGKAFDYDKFKLWIERQQLNFSKSLTLGGDLISVNWNGASPLDLSSEDTVASAGFALDSSEGAAQFEGNLFIAGDSYLTGNLRVTEGEISVDNENNDRSIEMSPSAAGATYLGIAWKTAAQGGGSINNSIRSSDAAPSDLVIEAGTDLLLWADTVNIGFNGTYPLIVNNSVALLLAGSASAPTLAFQGDTNTGLYRHAADWLGFTAGGTVRAIINSQGLLSAQAGSVSAPSFAFTGDADCGVYNPATNRLGLVAGGSEAFLLAGDLGTKTVVSTWIRDNTTASAANVFINATTGHLQRSTSSLKYKPDWTWAPDAVDFVLPTPIRWTDEKGQKRIGFGAEHIHEAVPEAYEEEVYDTRSLVAILSAKVARLEGLIGIGARP
jgi:hypothetical protein